MFAEAGAAASLEEVARRAGVGIGTLYRNFPNRRDSSRPSTSRRSGSSAGPPPTWPTCPRGTPSSAWLHRFVGYVATKRALAEELMHDSEVFRGCRTEIYVAGEPMLRRAQAAGAVRDDVSFDDVVRLISGLTMAQFVDRNNATGCSASPSTACVRRRRADGHSGRPDTPRPFGPGWHQPGEGFPDPGRGNVGAQPARGRGRRQVPHCPQRGEDDEQGGAPGAEDTDPQRRAQAELAAERAAEQGAERDHPVSRSTGTTR